LEEDKSLQVVVQAMPPHAELPKTASKLVFQEVVESLQRSSSNVPYVTITHTYTTRSSITLDEVPLSPPATPNIHGGGQGYFDVNTVFTHAARVPDYHAPSSSTLTEIGNPRVAAPLSVNVSTLERYIPPTTTDEVRDFFSLGQRSHLIDRLTELSARDIGSLLLVYPTKTGGQTFLKSYKNPVLDPMLRSFMLLRGLTMAAGTALGRMDAAESLMEFGDMQEKLQQLCEALPQHLRSSRPNKFTIAHAERAEVVLSRQTWIELFLAQESARMRQDLIEYQKSGQRMPSQGFEASPAALAREVEQGIRESKERAGGVGIEVAVFVIQRSLL
jgi:hypothetical protein